jgi:thioredoxin-related protein
MKRILTFLVLILLMGSLSAQKNQKGKNDTTAKPAGKSAEPARKADEAPYKSDPKIPAFNIMLPDSTWFTKDQLPMSKYDYTIIVYFSPDCGHCQHEATEIVKHMDSLKNAFFVFVAYKPLEDIKGFASYYKLDQFANVRVGRDPQYFVPSFFRVTRTPFVVLYNKQGQLEKVFDPEVAEVPEARDLIKLVYKN